MSLTNKLRRRPKCSLCKATSAFAINGTPTCWEHNDEVAELTLRAALVEGGMPEEHMEEAIVMAIDFWHKVRAESMDEN